MSKKFRGKVCVYCCRAESSTADHIFAREFFLISRRGNLPKVPSCLNCNREKSILEHYLTAMLPFGGQNIDNQLAVRDASRRVRRNLKLHKAIQESAKEAWLLQPSGFFSPRTLVPIDAKQISSLIKYWVKGLSFYHWNVLLRENVDIGVHPLHSELGDAIESLLRERAAQTLNQDIGTGTFAYSASQALDNPIGSAWKFSILGGMSLHTEKKKLAITHWAALTIPREDDALY